MSLVIPNLVEILDRAADEAGGLVAAMTSAVGGRVRKDGGGVDRAALDAEQHVAHGLASSPAYAETLRQTAEWARALSAERQFGEAAALPAQLLAHEYLSQLAGGIPMSQGEIFRAADVFHPAERLGHLIGRLRPGASQAAKTRIVELLDRARGGASLEASGLDETLEAVRDQFHAFTARRIAPLAHGWHLRDKLIPLSLLEELGDLGVFGLTAPEEWGGSGSARWPCAWSRGPVARLDRDRLAGHAVRIAAE